MRFLLAAGLLIFPGAWIAFGLPLRKFTLAARLALAGALSPLVLVIEYFPLRWLGAEFSTAAILLATMNLASIFFIVREWKLSLRCDSSRLADTCVVVWLGLCASIPWFLIDKLRIFNSHVWMHLPIVNQFASGRLIPEEPELAGHPLMYPWLAHLVWAILSWTTQLPLTWIYPLTNLFFLGCTSFLVLESVQVLGGKPSSARTGLIWMMLGTNWMGFWIWQFTDWLPGDVRYSPFLLKFLSCNTMPIAITQLAGLVLVGLLAVRERSAAPMLLVALLAACVGLFYPLIVPAPLLFCGILFLILAWEQFRKAEKPNWKIPILVAAGTTAAALISLAHVQFLSYERASSGVLFSVPRAALSKVASSIVALAPVGLGLWMLPRRRLLQKDAIFLMTSAAGCLLLYVVFQLGGEYHEYKFMFPIALLAFPLAACALDKWGPRKVSGAFVVVVSATLLTPTITIRNANSTLDYLLDAPSVVEQGGELRLGRNEVSGTCLAAIKEKSPPDTVLFIRRSDLILPAVLARSTWAPPEQKRTPQSYGYTSRFNLVRLRGVKKSIFDQREGHLQEVFACNDRCNPQPLLSEFQKLNRPLAFVFLPKEGQGFVSWLQSENHGMLLYQEHSGCSAWLLPVAPAR